MGMGGLRWMRRALPPLTNCVGAYDSDSDPVSYAFSLLAVDFVCRRLFPLLSRFEHLIEKSNTFARNWKKRMILSIRGQVSRPNLRIDRCHKLSAYCTRTDLRSAEQKEAILWKTPGKVIRSDWARLILTSRSHRVEAHVQWIPQRSQASASARGLQR